MKYKFFLITALALFCVKAAAQNGRITGIIELMSDNPYTARNSMPVIIDLNKRTIKMIEGIPCSDGHSVAIEYHDGLVYYSAFGVDKAGVFTYDPKTGEVKQTLSLSGNVNYIHFFD